MFLGLESGQVDITFEYNAHTYFKKFANPIPRFLKKLYTTMQGASSTLILKV